MITFVDCDFMVWFWTKLKEPKSQNFISYIVHEVQFGLGSTVEMCEWTNENFQT